MVTAPKRNETVYNLTPEGIIEPCIVMKDKGNCVNVQKPDGQIVNIQHENLYESACGAQMAYDELIATAAKQFTPIQLADMLRKKKGVISVTYFQKSDIEDALEYEGLQVTDHNTGCIKEIIDDRLDSACVQAGNDVLASAAEQLLSEYEKLADKTGKEDD